MPPKKQRVRWSDQHRPKVQMRNRSYAEPGALPAPEWPDTPRPEHTIPEPPPEPSMPKPPVAPARAAPPPPIVPQPYVKPLVDQWSPGMVPESSSPKVSDLPKCYPAMPKRQKSPSPTQLLFEQTPAEVEELPSRAGALWSSVKDYANEFNFAAYLRRRRWHKDVDLQPLPQPHKSFYAKLRTFLADWRIYNDPPDFRPSDYPARPRQRFTPPSGRPVTPDHSPSHSPAPSERSLLLTRDESHASGQDPDGFLTWQEWRLQKTYAFLEWAGPKYYFIIDTWQAFKSWIHSMPCYRRPPPSEEQLQAEVDADDAWRHTYALYIWRLNRLQHKRALARAATASVSLALSQPSPLTVPETVTILREWNGLESILGTWIGIDHSELGHWGLAEDDLNAPEHRRTRAEAGQRIPPPAAGQVVPRMRRGLAFWLGADREGWSKLEAKMRDEEERAEVGWLGETRLLGEGGMV